jgi:hypothetical protein
VASPFFVGKADVGQITGPLTNKTRCAALFSLTFLPVKTRELSLKTASRLVGFDKLSLTVKLI